MDTDTQNIIRPLENDNNSSQKKFPVTIVVIALVMVILGVLTGFGLSKISPKEKVGTVENKVENNKENKQNAGVLDKKTFPDNVEGIMREGGIDGEGQFHLERPGGITQNAYLTSSTVDLSEFIGKKVRVWGQTNKGQKAGWLMDVGYVEVL